MAMKHWFMGIFNIKDKHVYVCNNLRIMSYQFSTTIFTNIVSILLTKKLG